MPVGFHDIPLDIVGYIASFLPMSMSCKLSSLCDTLDAYRHACEWTNRPRAVFRLIKQTSAHMKTRRGEYGYVLYGCPASDARLPETLHMDDDATSFPIARIVPSCEEMTWDPTADDLLRMRKIGLARTAMAKHFRRIAPFRQPGSLCIMKTRRIWWVERRPRVVWHVIPEASTRRARACTAR